VAGKATRRAGGDSGETTQDIKAEWAGLPVFARQGLEAAMSPRILQAALAASRLSVSDGGSEKRGHSGSVGTDGARSHQDRAFLSCQEAFLETARSSQGRAVVGRGEGDP
jgi:hypothetical protein